MAATVSDAEAKQALADVLEHVAPFNALSGERRDAMVAAAEVVHKVPGDLVLDGFRHPSSDLYIVLTGRVGLWQEAESRGQPNQTLGAGGFFGFSTMLTGRTVGPRARAMTYCSLAKVPAQAADHAFHTAGGARFLADHLLSFAEKIHQLPGFSTTGSLVDQPPLVAGPNDTVADVARTLTDVRVPGVVVELPEGALGLVTDGSIRRRVVVEGVSPSAPAREALARDVPVVQVGDPAGEVLLEVLRARTEAAIVTDRQGVLQGVVGLREFALSPTSADVLLHEQLRLASSPDELVQKVRRTPEVMNDLLRQGLSADKVIKVHSGMVDTAVRRALELCLANHRELSLDGFTWLALGSNGRREAVLSSDVESAVVFPDGTTEEEMAAYREVFAEVHALLDRAGVEGDEHGVSARNRILARTESEWRQAVSGWLAEPWRDKGGVMVSLLVDSRPVFGDASLGGAGFVLPRIKAHPATMRLLLNDALANRAKVRQWDRAWRRNASFDIKQDALMPLVNLARWTALATGSSSLGTPDRLRDASGTTLLEKRQGLVLAEAFDVLQRVRLRCQLLQAQQGQRPGDRIGYEEISPIDRSILDEAVHEISLAQRRLQSVASYGEESEWQKGER